MTPCVRVSIQRDVDSHVAGVIFFYATANMPSQLTKPMALNFRIVYQEKSALQNLAGGYLTANS